MTRKVAIASSDGVFINQHFGRAQQFQIYVLDAQQQSFVLEEVRQTQGICSQQQHQPSLLSEKVAALSDCQMVLASRIGPGAADALLERGIEPYVVADFIEDALKKVAVFWQRQRRTFS